MGKRRVEITIETNELIVARRPGPRFEASCPDCGSLVRMAAVEEAMLFAGICSREIHRRVEAGRLHYLETADGHLLVCLDSLQDAGLEPRAGGPGHPRPEGNSGRIALSTLEDGSELRNFAE